MSTSFAAPFTESAALRATEVAPADGDLLARFLEDRDESAFEELVLRHGPKVMRACRRWLGPGQDADDAFQATFIVLVNRAGELRAADDLGGWLCGVARRVAGRSRMLAARRKGREGAGLDSRDAAGYEPAGLEDDLGPMIRAEVDRLPEKFRRPVQLCYWEGLSSEQARGTPGLPDGHAQVEAVPGPRDPPRPARPLGARPVRAPALEAPRRRRGDRFCEFDHFPAPGLDRFGRGGPAGGTGPRDRPAGRIGSRPPSTLPGRPGLGRRRGRGAPGADLEDRRRGRPSLGRNLLGLLGPV